MYELEVATDLLSELSLDQATLRDLTKKSPQQVALTCAMQYLTAAIHASGKREGGKEALKALKKLLDMQEVRRAELLLFTSCLSTDGTWLCDQLEAWGYYPELRKQGERLINQLNGSSAFHLRLQLGRANRYMGDLNKAKAHFNAVLGVPTEECNEVDRAWCFYELGLMQADLGSKNGDADALACFARAFRLFHKLGVAAGVIATQNSGARIAFEHGRWQAARRHFDRALSVPTQDVLAVTERAWALCDYGRFLTNQGHHSDARRPAFEALRIFRRTLQHATGTAWAYYGTGLVLVNLDHRRSARRALRAACEGFKSLGNRGGFAWTQHLLARIEIREGRYEEARNKYRQVVNIHGAENDRRGLIFALEGLARLAALDGSSELAAILFGGVAHMREAEAAPLAIADRLEYDVSLMYARSRFPDEALFDALWLQGRALTSEALVEMAVPVMPALE